MDEQLIQEVQAAGAVDAVLLKKLIDSNSYDASVMKANYDQYMGEVDILTRTFDDENKINRTLANDYISYIVDQFGGYFIGNPIVYDFNAEPYGDAEADKFSDLIRMFNIRSNIADGDAELNKLASICGKAYRLLYIDKEASERAVGLNPWEVIHIPKLDNDGAMISIRYRDAWRNGESVMLADVYDAATITYWIGKTSDGTKEVAFEPDNRGPGATPTREHLFDEVPIIEFVANKEKQNDFEKVQTLIDSYDRSLSDCQNEVEEFRLSYMKFTGGVRIDSNTVQEARNTGAFSLPEGGDVEFLTKNMPETFIGEHFKRLNENILRFAKAVDMSDENFSGASQSGESRKWKLISLETKAITRELKFTAALLIQYRVLSSAWRKKDIGLRYEDMLFTFTRNIPVEVASSAAVAQLLTGIVSKRTVVSLLPFVKDIDAELKRIEDEGLNLDEPRLQQPEEDE